MEWREGCFLGTGLSMCGNSIINLKQLARSQLNIYQTKIQLLFFPTCHCSLMLYPTSVSTNIRRRASSPIVQHSAVLEEVSFKSDEKCKFPLTAVFSIETLFNFKNVTAETLWTRTQEQIYLNKDGGAIECIKRERW